MKYYSGIVVQFKIEQLRLLRNLLHYLDKAPNSAERSFNFILLSRLRLEQNKVDSL